LNRYPLKRTNCPYYEYIIYRFPKNNSTYYS